MINHGDEFLSKNTLVLITILMTMSPFFVVNFPILTAARAERAGETGEGARAAGLAAAHSSAAAWVLL